MHKKAIMFPATAKEIQARYTLHIASAYAYNLGPGFAERVKPGYRCVLISRESDPSEPYGLCLAEELTHEEKLFAQTMEDDFLEGLQESSFLAIDSPRSQYYVRQFAIKSVF